MKTDKEKKSRPHSGWRSWRSRQAVRGRKEKKRKGHPFLKAEREYPGTACKREKVKGMLGTSGRKQDQNKECGWGKAERLQREEHQEGYCQTPGGVTSRIETKKKTRTQTKEHRDRKGPLTSLERIKQGAR